jgi:hypothetical protein
MINEMGGVKPWGKALKWLITSEPRFIRRMVLCGEATNQVVTAHLFRMPRHHHSQHVLPEPIVLLRYTFLSIPHLHGKGYCTEQIGLTSHRSGDLLSTAYQEKQRGTSPTTSAQNVEHHSHCRHQVRRHAEQENPYTYYLPKQGEQHSGNALRQC